MFTMKHTSGNLSIITEGEWYSLSLDGYILFRGLTLDSARNLYAVYGGARP